MRQYTNNHSSPDRNYQISSRPKDGSRSSPRPPQDTTIHPVSMSRSQNQVSSHDQSNYVSDINYNNNKCLGIVRFNTQTIIQSRKTFCARFQPLTGTFKRARTEQLGDRCSVQPCFDHPGPVANPGNILPQINVRDIKGMSLVIDIVVNGHETEAVVDTAANVTLISESFFNSLPCHNTPLGKTVILRGISEHPMEGKLCDGLNIRIGHQTYQWNVCIAPISDNILLGIDFLRKHSCLVDLGKNILHIGSQHIPAKLKITPDDCPIKISRVNVTRKSVIPPQSVGFVQGKMLHPHPDHYIFEPLPQREGVFVSSVYAVGNEFNVKVINDSDRYLTFKEGRMLGVSEPCSPLPSRHQRPFQLM